MFSCFILVNSSQFKKRELLGNAESINYIHWHNNKAWNRSSISFIHIVSRTHDEFMLWNLGTWSWFEGFWVTKNYPSILSAIMSKFWVNFYSSCVCVYMSLWILITLHYMHTTLGNLKLYITLYIQMNILSQFYNFKNYGLLQTYHPQI